MSAEPEYVARAKGETTPYCCFIEADGRTACDANAEWEIENPFTSPDIAVTHACTEHVGNLLDDAPIQYIAPIKA